MTLRLGLAHHLGWAVAVVATPEFEVVDRRRVELIEPDLPVAPIHHEGGAHEMHRTGPSLDDAALAKLAATVRASVVGMGSLALDELQGAVDAPISSISVRDWPADFPVKIADQRRAPYESRADSIMYCQVLAELGADRGWAVHRFDNKTVEAEAAELLGDRADEVLRGPRARLGPPWAKDHRLALAATVLAG